MGASLNGLVPSPQQTGLSAVKRLDTVFGPTPESTDGTCNNEQEERKGFRPRKGDDGNRRTERACSERQVRSIGVGCQAAFALAHEIERCVVGKEDEVGVRARSAAPCRGRNPDGVDGGYRLAGPLRPRIPVGHGA